MKTVALILFFIMALPALAFATSKTTVQKTEQIQVPPKLNPVEDDNGPISNKTINDYYDSCKYHIPPRFTPNAREYYCACNSAAVQGNLHQKEFNDVQLQSNHVAGNKSFEKYVTTAVGPCLDAPVREIEYLDCVVDASLDARVGYVPGYCSCVSKKLMKHAQKFAGIEMMKRIAEAAADFADPVNALWDNGAYIQAKLQARQDCLAAP